MPLGDFAPPLEELVAYSRQRYGLTIVRKMITRNIGLMYHGLPQSPSPGSVLYGPILGVADLDGIGEDI